MPTKDDALKNFCRTLLSIAEPSQNCTSNGHDTLTILYFSSLLFTTGALRLQCNGRRFWEVIERTIRNSPRSAVCVVRTTAPRCFPRGLSDRQREALNIMQKYVMYESMIKIVHMNF
jgi:hypothetical protein